MIIETFVVSVEMRPMFSFIIIIIIIIIKHG